MELSVYISNERIEICLLYTSYFDSHIYEKRVYNGVGKADPSVEIQFGPNIKDWPSMVPLTDNILLKVVSEIHDPVTTTDELIPSGETSSFRSNPLGLAEFTLSRKDPEYVGRAKKVRAAEEAREDGKCPCQADDEVAAAFNEIHKLFPDVKASETEIGSVIYAVKPGDGSAREQAASCQRVLGLSLIHILSDKLQQPEAYQYRKYGQEAALQALVLPHHMPLFQVHHSVYGCLNQESSCHSLQAFLLRTDE